MSTDKHGVIESLHSLQNNLHDTREYLAQMPIGRNAKQLNQVYEMLMQSEFQLENILDDDYWG